MLYNVALASMVQLYVFVVVQSLNRVQLFSTPWTEACHASLSFTISWSLLKLMPTDSVMPSNHSSSITPFSSCPQTFSSSRSFPMNQLFASGGQSTGASASASVLPMNIQGGFPLRVTGLISSLSKGLWRVLSSTSLNSMAARCVLDGRYSLFPSWVPSGLTAHCLQLVAAVAKN